MPQIYMPISPQGNVERDPTPRGRSAVGWAGTDMLCDYPACHICSPFVGAPPIEPGRTAVYVYKLTEQNIGSYWLHSHYGFQHELGLAIPLVVDGPMPALYPFEGRIDEMGDAVMFLEDFCGFARDAPDGNRGCMQPSEVYTTLREAWEEEEPTFDFEECEDAAEGEETWDVGYRTHLANGRSAEEPQVLFGTHPHRPHTQLHSFLQTGGRLGVH